MRRRRSPALVLAGLLVLTAAPGSAQVKSPPASPPVEPGSEVVEVRGVEYAFIGLPDSLAVGTRLAFDNVGAEFHELAVARIVDDPDTTLEELVTLGAMAFTDGVVEMLPEGPLVANPGETAEGMLTLTAPGRYLVTCLVPQGMVPGILAGLGVTGEMEPAEWPPEAQAILDNPTHAELGMVQLITVTP